MSDPAVPEPSRQPSLPWAERIDRLRSTVATLPRAALIAGIAGVALAAVVAFVVLRPSSAPRPLVLPRADAAAPASGAPPASDQAAPAETVTVHAAGAVARPGVYIVPGRARVADVLAAAGGALPDADVDQLNLAAKLSDAERVYVPRKGEAPAPPPAASSTGAGTPAGAGTGAAGSAGPIDLNQADATQLDALPGVGPTTSKAIVAYRSAHGRFRSVTDLLAVPGIGPAKLDAIRPLVTVSGG